ncbi:uracil-DNA glycosylase [Evansella sp. AB-P1]|uniref:uracil-DNA glycosylase n=1 Tax=Evansella sp. AB-P1 TaxID=3037653 RepID=UPI00241F1D2E|nr:uracil-DNA glycosylase [Evansella sp. AB-P1]MDG5787408.1 uracil-DNA glycosylase [Evansella sp. AB-P1]
MMNNVKNDWSTLLQDECHKPYYKELWAFLEKEYKEKTVYPNKDEIFHALHTTSYEKTKAVILGQDPYHGPNQAHGLSFSVQPGVQIPRSLYNIYKELKDDLGYEIPKHGHLQKWTDEGVLLLNTVLTVQAHEADSHQGKGWELFTDKIIRKLNEREKPVVFILWGRKSQAKLNLITNSHHYIIQSPHPSPLSARRGFFGSKPFSKTNEFLRSIGVSEIDWEIPIQIEKGK